MELVDYLEVTLLGAVDVADPRVDELSWQLSSTRAEIILSTSKLYDLEKVRYKAKLEHEELWKKLRPEAELSRERIGAEHEGALSCYHGVSRSIRGIVKVTDEQNAGHADTLTHLRLLFKEGRKVKMVLTLAGPSRKGLLVAELERALGVKELEWPTLRGLASEIRLYVQRSVG